MTEKVKIPASIIVAITINIIGLIAALIHAMGYLLTEQVASGVYYTIINLLICWFCIWVLIKGSGLLRLILTALAVFYLVGNIIGLTATTNDINPMIRIIYYAPAILLNVVYLWALVAKGTRYYIKPKQSTPTNVSQNAKTPPSPSKDLQNSSTPNETERPPAVNSYMKNGFIYISIATFLIFSICFLYYANKNATFPFELKTKNITYKYYRTNYVEPKDSLYTRVLGKAGDTVFAQVKFDIENKAEIPLRYKIELTLFDKDGFKLDELMLDSKNDDGDLASNYSRTVYIPYKTNINLYRQATDALINISSYKTDREIQQSKAAELQARREPWFNLRKGMKKEEVQKILGKPLKVTSYDSLGWENWSYGDYYGAGTVKFTAGTLNSWEIPQ